MISRILVIGGTGMLGLPVARQLKSDGFEVTIMTTNLAAAQERLGDRFPLVYGDVTRPDTLREPMSDCDAVYINLSAHLDPDLYEQVEVRGTMNIAWTAVKQGLKRIGMISGASSTGEEKGVIFLDSKVKAERAVMESGIPYTIMRPSWFFESLPGWVRGNKAPVLGRQPIERGWLAAADYARQVSVAFQKDAAANKCFYNVGPQKMTITEAVKRFCARHHPDIEVINVPFFVARLLTLWPSPDRAVIKKAIPFFQYFEHRPEEGDPGEADRLLGPNLTTLDEWLDRYRPKTD